MKIIKVLSAILAIAVFVPFTAVAQSDFEVKEIDGIFQIKVFGFKTIKTSGVEELEIFLRAQALTFEDITSAAVEMQEGTSVFELAGQQVSLSEGDKILFSLQRGLAVFEVVYGTVTIKDILTGESRTLSAGDKFTTQIVTPDPIEVSPEPEIPDEEVEASPYIP